MRKSDRQFKVDDLGQSNNQDERSDATRPANSGDLMPLRDAPMLALVDPCLDGHKSPLQIRLQTDLFAILLPKHNLMNAGDFSAQCHNWLMERVTNSAAGRDRAFSNLYLT